MLLVSVIFGATRYVTFTGAGSKNGSSWANAYEGLQSALSAAGNGDEIWVAAGTYYPSLEIQGSGDRYKTFQLKNGVAIYGGFAGTESAVSERSDFGLDGANESILSGDIGTPGVSSDNCYHVINHPDALTGIPGSTSLMASAVLDGFTIRDGYADGPEYYDQFGGGMTVHRGDPTLRNLVLVSNYANNGGGMHLYVSVANLSNIRFIQNTTGNGNGGGIHIYRCNGAILLDQVEFIENTAGANGGGIYFQESSAPAIRNARFFSNSASNGGAVYISSECSPTIANALFVENEANGTGGWDGEGGAIYIYNGSPQLVNATFTFNSSTYYGGAILSSGSSSASVFSNCIIWNNSSTSGHEVTLYSGSMTLDHSCYGNQSGDIYGSPMATNCINSDPQFASASPNPYHIYGISPCVDAGSDAANSLDYDIRGTGFPRKLDKTTGGTGTIDMGAYEYKLNTDYYDAEDIPLPISLASFSAAALYGSVSVTWVTESETENAAFRIYRDGEMIAEREGAGTTSEPQSYSWTDQYVIPGRTYTYQLADVSFDGEETRHSRVEVEVKAEGIAQDYNIGAAYPNPFNPETLVPLNLAKEAVVTATLYDLTGRPLRNLHKGMLAAGSHDLKIDGTNLSTGIYFVHINVNNAIHMQKIALMK